MNIWALSSLEDLVVSIEELFVERLYFPEEKQTYISSMERIL